MTYTITIKLSDTRYNQLRRAAELANRPVDTIVEESLAPSLPPRRILQRALERALVHAILAMRSHHGGEAVW